MSSHQRPLNVAVCTLICGIAGAAALARATIGLADAAPSGFDRKAWVQDYAHLKSALEASYANLAWFASPESGVNLPAIDRRTSAAIEQATSDAEARLAIRDFVSSLHDGHFSELPPLSP